MTGLTSPAHIAVVLVVLLLVFGAKRLPELGRSLGHGLREFKDSIGGETSAERPELSHQTSDDGVEPQTPGQLAAAVQAPRPNEQS